MEWINISSFVVGIAGLLLAVIQQIRIGNNKKKDYRRYWDIAKTAHMVQDQVFRLRSGLQKTQNCSADVLITSGRAYEAAKQLVRLSLQNVFLQNVDFDE